MDVTGLAAKLPKSTLPAVVDKTAGCQVSIHPRLDYVAPNLTQLSNLKPEEAPATLITAPAAAGKSTSGLAIAAITNAVYLDLSGQRVGVGSFTGLLDLAFGEDDGLALRKKIRSGAVTLVIDALDETQVASQEAAFVSYLTGLARFLRTAQGSGNIVLLARLDTSEYIQETFTQENVNLHRYEIDYFDREQSERFIDLKLSGLYQNRGMPLAHTQHVAHFQKARDSLFSRLASAIGHSNAEQAWDSPDGRRLLGYSPVLEGMASYLCVPDFRKLEIAHQGSGDGNLSEWRILTKLMLDLLGREQVKFKSSWPDELSLPMFEDSETIQRIYNPQEQCERLLVRASKLKAQVIQPMVPRQLEESYAQAVASQLPNHPFLSSSSAFINTLFADFACALVLQSSGDEKILDGLLKELRSSGTLASPGLGPFIISLATDSSIQARWTDLIISSMASRDDTLTEYRYEISFSDSAGMLKIESVKNGQVTSSLHLPLTTSDREIKLPARLKNIIIDGASQVDIAGKSLRIGPSVDIAAEMVTLYGEEVVIDASSPVTIDADLIAAPWEQTEIVHGEHLRLIANETEGWPQKYARAHPENSGHPELREYFRSFRAILRHFRKTQHVESYKLAASRDELDSYVFKRDKRARQILFEISDHGWWRTEGPDYILDRTLLNALNTDLSSIHGYELNDEIAIFLRQASTRPI